MSRQMTIEFSRRLAAADVPLEGQTFHIEADAEERAALAARFRLLAIEDLAATGSVDPEAGGRRLRMTARLEADVVQECVVTLEPVRAHIDVRFERLWEFDIVDEWSDVEGSASEIVLTVDDEPFPEPIEGGAIDIGEATAEQLALELDPFPRAPGAVFDPTAAQGHRSASRGLPENAFAALARLKNKVDRRP